MQVLDPLDPTMIILYGIIVAVLILLYATTIRQPTYQSTRVDGINSMVGGRVDKITTGAVQEPMLDHLVSVEEERMEHEGEVL